MKYRIQLQIPNVPYSVFRVDWEDPEEAPAVPDIAEAVSAWSEALIPLFPQATPPPQQSSPPPPPAPQRAPAQPQQGNRVLGEVVYCPDCRQQLEYYTNDQYSKWEMGQDGREYAQVFACTNASCVAPGKKTKAVWRSKVVWPQ